MEVVYEGHERDIIDEDRFKWLVAEYLLCPVSVFRLVYEASGAVQVVFGAQEETRRRGFVCSLCTAMVMPMRDPIQPPYQLIGPWNNRTKNYDARCWACPLCIRTGAYITYTDEEFDALPVYSRDYLGRLASIIPYLKNPPSFSFLSTGSVYGVTTRLTQS